MPVRLTRNKGGAILANGMPAPRYTACVTVKGSGSDPFQLAVYGPDPRPEFRRNTSDAWMVESDTERFFATLGKAREYINRFFEPAK